MGIAPLATVEIFARTPADRLAAEEGVRAFLTTAADVSLPSPTFMQDLIAGKLPPAREPPPRLSVSFLSVKADSCYGQLHFQPLNMVDPEPTDWELTKQLCARLLERRLCSAVILRRGCESKGLFGVRSTAAVVGSADFAKLAVLKRLELIRNPTALGTVVNVLTDGAAQTVCESQWKSLVKACAQDQRFSPILK